MADGRMIARLADLREFAQLKQAFDERCEAEVQALARKTFKLPEAHDRLEWEKLRAFYAGVDAVLALPVKEREALTQQPERKESQ